MTDMASIQLSSLDRPPLARRAHQHLANRERLKVVAPADPRLGILRDIAMEVVGYALLARREPRLVAGQRPAGAKLAVRPRMELDARHVAGAQRPALALQDDPPVAERRAV